MHKIIRPRGGGKTAKIIKMSAELNRQILVTDSKRAYCIRKEAQTMGIDILPPVTVDDFKRTGGFKHNYIPEVLIDDAESVLRMLLSPVDIIAISMSTYPSDDIVKAEVNKNGR